MTVPASGEVHYPNDEARATFLIEEQGKDGVAGSSRVNQNMARGIEIIKHNDPRASLKTRGYYAYPVYQDEPRLSRQSGKARQPVSWRAGQYLEFTTNDLVGLAKATAAAQSVLALSHLHFSLSTATSRGLQEQGIAAAIRT